MSETTLQTFKITGMDCAGCAKTVENGVSKLDGIERCELSFTSELMRVEGSTPVETIVGRVRDLGFDIADPAEETDDSVSPIEPPSNFFQFMWSRSDTQLALLAILLILPGLILHEFLPGLGLESPLLDLASVAALVLAGYPVALSAWRALSINREININVLMTIAAIGALIIGEYTEAGVVMVLFVIGEAMEGYTAERARGSIRSLLSVAPSEATRLVSDGCCSSTCGSFTEEIIPIKSLAVGDRILVKPGERIPMDGTVLAGISAVNQAPITGESALIEKEIGSGVFASSINGTGSLEIEVTHLAADNTIARVIKMVEEAQDKRAPAQRLVDTFAKYYTPAVVVLAFLVAILPPLLWGAPFFNPSAEVTGWLYRALTLLVVACPCALVISTPVSIVSAISNGARNGIILKGGAVVETLSKVQAIAFDKTGTLTKGEPAVVQFKSADCQALNSETCDDCNDLLALASAVEARSEHPLAQAVLTQAETFGVTDRYSAAKNVRALTGRGVTGEVEGLVVTIGSHRYFDQNIPHGDFCEAVGAVDDKGFTTMLVGCDDRYQGFIAVADEVRETSREALAELKAAGMQNLVMLTGDNAQTAAQVADAVGVTEVQANCLPEDKVSAVNNLLEKYGTVAMVGDGINDAPALATASAGIAIGNTAQAMETADVSLMGDSLKALPYLIKLCRAAMQTIRVNIAFSIGVKLVFLLMVLLGTGSMWMAILADVGTSVLVTLNGMRLLNRSF
ncbi:MAG: heavy metal translocating P-type ATPase [Anaerolineae bacterium]